MRMTNRDWLESEFFGILEKWSSKGIRDGKIGTTIKGDIVVLDSWKGKLAKNLADVFAISVKNRSSLEKRLDKVI